LGLGLGLGYSKNLLKFI